MSFNPKMQSTTPMYDQSEFPPELCAKPLALVGFSGLDTLNNAIHKAVWEMFNNNRRVERSPVLFKLISNAHEFPVVKPKRNSYEWYIPKGILKRNWMNKHLNEIPAVVAIFYDLDWNDSQWSEKMIECASRVQSMRAALEGRNTRIVVVLIQDAPPLPAGEDVQASERAIALCASCELNAKSLFVLPHGDHLQGYVVRLEGAFYDLTQNYYHLEAKNVKSHKEHLNKSTHAFLFVRHQFKIGFLSEMRQDNQTGHKHYTYAYNNLMEIRLSDANALEVRTVAGFINYKLCRLMFLLNLPRDAIAQFRNHNDCFKLRVGVPELSFEHFAWLAKQHSIFGDIFEEAVKLGLSAVQIQHPGVYYQQAALYAIQRKNACKEYCSSVSVYPAPDPLDGLKHLEFYGQRPWRQGKGSAEGAEANAENPGIIALQFLEKQVNHSSMIISLFGLAISQYKAYKCLRMRRQLVVQMADEYYDSEDYGKALTLYRHMLWDYRSELWWDLITDLLRKALNCAYLTGNAQDYVTVSLELLDGRTTIGSEQKKRVYDNLNRVLIKKIPEAEHNLPQKPRAAAFELWKHSLTVQPLRLALDMSQMISCIECKTRFTLQKYQADQDVTIELYVCNTSEHFLKFAAASVTIKTPDYSKDVHVDVERYNLGFNSNEVKQFLVQFKPAPNDVGKEIQIGAVNLQLGGGGDDEDNVCAVEMKFNGKGNDDLKVCLEFSHFRRATRSIYEFDNLRPTTSALITPRHPKLFLEFIHNAPALLEEWYEVAISLRNEEQFPIANLEIVVNLGEATLQEQSTEVYLSDSDAAVATPLKQTIATLQQTETTHWKFFIRSHVAGSKVVEIKITYLLQSEQAVMSMTEEILDINVVQPFEVSASFISRRMEPIHKFNVDEMFGVMPLVSFKSPWPIAIVDTYLELDATLESCLEPKSYIAGYTFKKDEKGKDMFFAKPLKSSDMPITVGKYVVKWQRANGRITMAEVVVAGLPVEWIPIYLESKLPAYGQLRTPLTATYTIRNKSQQLVQLNLHMDHCSAFLVAGYKQLQISVLPNSEKALHYNFFPLIIGDCHLPKLTLTVPENSTEGPSLRQDQLDSLVHRTLKRNLFIMPQNRSGENIDYFTQLQLIGK